KQTHRIFRKSTSDMPQDTSFQIVHTTTGIDQGSIGPLGNRIDRKVTTEQIIFQRDVGAGIKGETLVTPARLAFRSGKRVFLLGTRMQKDRKIAPHWNEAPSGHLFGTGTDNHPITIAR